MVNIFPFSRLLRRAIFVFISYTKEGSILLTLELARVYGATLMNRKRNELKKMLAILD
jgi:hypothetical protein